MAQFPAAAPNVDGLPAWLQVFVSLAFALTLIWGAFATYRKRVDREPTGAGQTIIASLPDMSAVRDLNEQCRILCLAVQGLAADMNDHTHYLRDKIETDRELCMRLRELKEEIIRSDRQRFHGGG